MKFVALTNASCACSAVSINHVFSSGAFKDMEFDSVKCIIKRRIKNVTRYTYNVCIVLLCACDT